MIKLQHGDFGMKRAIFAAICTALGACSQPSAQQSFSDKLYEGYKQDQEREKELADKLNKMIDESIAAVREPLKRFELEKPKRCSSKNLDDARTHAAAIVLSTDEKAFRAWGANGVSAKLGAALDYADVARKAGCKQRAEELYELVISTLTGTAYAAFRQRAEIGLKALQPSRR